METPRGPAPPPQAPLAAPGPGPPPSPPELPEGVRPSPRWPWWSGLAAFAAALISATALGAVVGLIAAAGGADVENPSPALTIVGTLIQDTLFVAAAIAFASMTLRPRPWQFGFKRARFWPAVGWSALGLFAYYLFSIVYTAALGVDEEQTTLDDLGAEDSAFALVAVGVMVIVLAPVVEEFLFRGFLYRALRNRLSVWPAALAGGIVFGIIHVLTGALAVPPLVFLGVVLCLVYERTGSLYPVIAMHAFNNTLAYLVQTEAVVLSLSLGVATIVACAVAPLLARARAPAFA